MTDEINQTAAAATVLKDANDLREAAKKEAALLLEVAKETSRELIIKSGLDVSQLPLICFKIVKISDDMAAMREMMTKSDGDQNNKIASLELSRAEQKGFKMSWREIGAAVIAIVSTGVTIYTLWHK